MNKTLLIIAVTIIIGLTSTVYYTMCEELDTKANNETIMKVIEQMKEQRIEDRTAHKEQRKEDQQELKEQRSEQQSVNIRIMQSIEKMLQQKSVN